MCRASKERLIRCPITDFSIGKALAMPHVASDGLQVYGFEVRRREGVLSFDVPSLRFRAFTSISIGTKVLAELSQSISHRGDSHLSPTIRSCVYTGVKFKRQPGSRNATQGRQTCVGQEAIDRGRHHHVAGWAIYSFI